MASKKIVSDKNSYKIVESSDAQMINKEQNHYGDENRPLVSVSRVPMNVGGRKSFAWDNGSKYNDKAFLVEPGYC